MNQDPRITAVLNDYPPLDGFLFASKLRCNLTFRSLAIQEFEAMRRATGLRNRTWCVPQDSSILIPAYDSYERQVYIPAGSVIWGYSFVGLTGNPTVDDEEVLGTQSWEVRDACDDIPLFSEIATRRFAAQSPTGVNLGVNPVPQQILSRLLVIGPPGCLNVVIANTFATAQVGQLLLFGGQPHNA